MKSIVLLLGLILGTAQFASAEEFTLTRSDGKVFTCSDQGGSGGSFGGVPLCNCVNNYGTTIGQVFGANLLTQCRTMTSAGRISGCTKLSGSIDIIACGCINNYGTTIGTVIGANALEECRAMTSSGRISGCKSL